MASESIILNIDNASTHGFDSINEDRPYNSKLFTNMFSRKNGLWRNKTLTEVVDPSATPKLNFATEGIIFGHYFNLEEQQIEFDPTTQGKLRKDILAIRIDRNQGARQISLVLIQGDEEATNIANPAFTLLKKEALLETTGIRDFPIAIIEVLTSTIVETKILAPNISREKYELPLFVMNLAAGNASGELVFFDPNFSGTTSQLSTPENIINDNNFKILFEASTNFAQNELFKIKEFYSNVSQTIKFNRTDVPIELVEQANASEIKTLLNTFAEIEFRNTGLKINMEEEWEVVVNGVISNNPAPPFVSGKIPNAIFRENIYGITFQNTIGPAPIPMAQEQTNQNLFTYFKILPSDIIKNKIQTIMIPAKLDNLVLSYLSSIIEGDVVGQSGIATSVVIAKKITFK